MSLFRKLFQYVDKSSDIPDLIEDNNRFIVDGEKEQLIVDAKKTICGRKIQ